MLLIGILKGGFHHLPLQRLSLKNLGENGYSDAHSVAC